MRPAPRKLFAFLFVFILLASTAWAEAEAETPVDDPLEPAAQRLKRGLHNTALGWIEMPLGVRDIGEEHGFGAAATWGVLHGVGRAVQRTAIGVFEVFTFPFDINEDNKPLMEPEFVIK